MLTPHAAQTIGMILHELATNAVRYGALSTPRGRVVLTCGIAETEEGRWLRIVWTESAGPAVLAPDRRGLGHSVIEEAAVRHLRGRPKVEFRAEGVVYTLDAPLNAVIA